MSRSAWASGSNKLSRFKISPPPSLTHSLEYSIASRLVDSLWQVLAESEQMRKEADDIGPRAELDHWKKRMSKFNYLLDQIKSDDVKTVLGILQTAKSKSIKVCPH